jgi:hypothetical protein
MVTALMKNLSGLWSKEAGWLYAGAAFAFYGSRAVWTWAVKPLFENVLFKDITAEERVGLRAAENYKEVVDVLVGAGGLMLSSNVNWQRGVVAGFGLSFIDHLLDRFPQAGANVPR